MKTQKSKFFVSVLAIIFAITTSAFTAAENSEVDESLLTISGYVPNPILGHPCDQVTVDCKINGTELCTYGAGMDPVYRTKGATTCSFQLYKN